MYPHFFFYRTCDKIGSLIFELFQQNEPSHDKTNKMASAQSDQYSLSAWRKLWSLATQWAHNEDPDQTGRMPSLIWVFNERTVIVLVLSWGGSNVSSQPIANKIIKLRKMDLNHCLHCDLKTCWNIIIRYLLFIIVSIFVLHFKHQNETQEDPDDCFSQWISPYINRLGCLEHDIARKSKALHWNFIIPRATSCSRYPDLFIVHRRFHVIIFRCYWIIKKWSCWKPDMIVYAWCTKNDTVWYNKVWFRAWCTRRK